VFWKAWLLALAGLSVGAVRHAPSVFLPTLSGRDAYGESHTFIADLDDGTYVHISLAITNLGPGGLKGICQGRVVPPRGPAWRAFTRVGRDGWSWKGGDGEHLQIGPCSAWLAGGETRVEVPLEGSSVRLLFSAIPRGRAGRDTVVVQGTDLYRSEIFLSRTPVTATLALPGRPPWSASGSGYYDHSRSTIPPRQIARRWVRFRALRGPRPLLLLGREGPDGRMGPVWTCRGPSDCRVEDSFEVERTGGDSAPTFRVSVRGEGRTLTLTSGRLIYREAPIEDLGIIGKLVAPFVGSPVNYVCRAQATGEGDPIDGVLEVETDG
jgi:hypothetical protein